MQVPESLFGLIAGRKPRTAKDMIAHLLNNVGSDNPQIEELFKVLGSRRQQADEQLSQSGQMLTSATNAPPPETPPLADLVARSIGNVAASFTGTEAPRQQAEDIIKSKQHQLMVKRTQELSQLKDMYDKAFERSSKLGDIEATLKYGKERDKAGQDLDTQYKVLSALVDVEKTQTQAQVDLKRFAMQQAGEEFNPADYIDTSPGGHQYINISDIPSQKAKLKASNYAKKNKVSTLNATENNVINMVQDANANISTIRTLIIPELATDWKDIVGKGKRWVDAKTQANPVLASYPAIRTAAIQFIQTIAGLGKGLRINQAEIQAALKFDIPEVTDTQDVANDKLNLLQSMVNHVERAALGLPPDEHEMQDFLKKSRDLHSKSERLKKASSSKSNVQVDPNADWANDMMDELLPNQAPREP